MVLVFLAPGFEEVEALTAVDVLRRAGLTVMTVGIGGRAVTGSHGISVLADRDDETPLPRAADGLRAIVLPGGLPGTPNLENSPVVREALADAARDGLYLCALCAAPSVLGHLGYLNGYRATCYPGYEDQLIGAETHGDPVVTDRDRITATGVGTALDFALAITAALVSPEKAKQLGEAMQCR